MGYWVYLARCADNSIYTGATTDLYRRVREHNAGSSKGQGAKYTSSHRPVTLAQAWEVESWSDALRLEHAIKKCGKLEKEQFILLPQKINQLAVKHKFTFQISVISKEFHKKIEDSLD
jgi:putative endonuclease